MELVSIIIPTYNYGKYIAEAIESVLAQTYPNIEVIVVDDESTDNTQDIVKKYPSVKYVYNKHRGARTPASAINTGISISKGKYIVCLAADDKLHPQYVEKCIRVIRKDKSIGFVWTATYMFGECNEVLLPRILHHRFSIFRGTGGQFGAAMVRREVYEDVGLYDESLPAVEDWDMAIRICRKGWKAVPIFEPLHYRRMHSDSIAHIQEKLNLVRYLERKYPLMKPYNYLSMMFDRLVMIFTNPKKALLRLWNRKICRLFKCSPILEPPTSIQHQAINELKILSLIKGEKILDCGCGIGRWGYLLKKRDCIVVGFDIYKQYLKQAKATDCYFGLIRADISCLPFKQKAFDTSLAIEVIEHAAKEVGWIFLEELKRTSEHRVILTTPEGILHLYFGDDHPETHKSGWTKKELESLGFRCVRSVTSLGNWLLCIYSF
ncbi:MAG: glycosyltransferase [Candidatus Bathycorpusculaceae bacterium]